MTYRHKKMICSKKTQDILEDSRRQDGKYASVQFASVVNIETREKSMEEEVPEAENVLDDDVDCIDEIQLPPMPVNETEGLEDYAPIEEPTFEVEATKIEGSYVYINFRVQDNMDRYDFEASYGSALHYCYCVSGTPKSKSPAIYCVISRRGFRSVV